MWTDRIDIELLESHEDTDTVARSCRHIVLRYNTTRHNTALITSAPHCKVGQEQKKADKEFAVNEFQMNEGKGKRGFI